MLTSAHALLVIAFAVLHVLVILRALLVDGRDPMSRAAWVLALLLLPGIGVALYLLVGEPRLARRLRHRSGSVNFIEHSFGPDAIPLGQVCETFYSEISTGV